MFLAFRKLVIFLVWLVVLVVAAAVVIPFFVPMETYRAQLQERLSAAAGREVTLAGDMQLVLLPDIALEIDDVTVANPEGFEDATMAQVEKLSLTVALAPLLEGRIAIRELSLESPKIHLRRNIRGKNNWELQSSGTDKASAANDASSGASASGKSPVSIDMQAVHLRHGTVTWRDTAKKALYTMEGIDLSFERSDKPMVLSGTAMLDGRQVRVEATLSTLASLMEEGKGALEFNASLGKEANVSFNGMVGLPFVLEGKLGLDVPSINRLAGQLNGNSSVISGDTLGALRLAAASRITAEKTEMKDMEVQFDDVRAKGRLAIAYGGTIPVVGGSLFVDALDLNHYLPQDESTGSAGGEGEAAATSHPGEPSGWSREAIDFSFLKAAQLDISTSIKKLMTGRMTMHNVNAELLLRQGKMSAKVKSMELYDGKGTAGLTVDAGRNVPEINLQLALQSVTLRPMLEDAIQEKRLSGTGMLEFSVSGYGKSQHAVVSSLRGGGKFRLENGTIRGINLGQMLRNIKSAFKPTDTAERSTDFADLSGTVTVDGGVAYNRDLLLNATGVRASGQGQANLVARRLNYRLVPKFVATMKGQQDPTAEERPGVTVPVIIEGPFDNLSFRPDLVGLIEEGLKDPEAIKQSIDSIKDMRKNVKEDVKTQVDDAKQQLQDIKGSLKQLKEMDSGDKEKAIENLITPFLR